MPLGQCKFDFLFHSHAIGFGCELIKVCLYIKAYVEKTKAKIC